MILTNPPFGGEEERGILGNFPEDKQTCETALLFLQLIMRKLQAPAETRPAAVVVPNGTLFGDGVCARIKEELLKDFNLHTIVRLPNGVFAPYTRSNEPPFFDRSGPRDISGTTSSRCPKAGRTTPRPQPIQFEEFADCLRGGPTEWSANGPGGAGFARSMQRPLVEGKRLRTGTPPRRPTRSVMVNAKEVVRLDQEASEFRSGGPLLADIKNNSDTRKESDLLTVSGKRLRTGRR